MLAIIDMVRQKTAERDVLLSTLEMQARIMSQGIDVHLVKSYGYDPLKDKRLRHQRPLASPWRKTLVAVYNYVILEDGTRIDMEPVPVPLRGVVRHETDREESAGTSQTHEGQNSQ